MAIGKGPEVATAMVTLIPSFKGGKKAIQNLFKEAGLDKSAGGNGKKLGEEYGKGFSQGFDVKKLIPAALVAGGAAAMTSFFSGAVMDASNAEQSIGAVQSIYGEMANTVIEQSKKASQAIGINANEYRELASVTGALLSGKGMEGNEVVNTMEQLMTIGADFSAAFGGTTKEAMEAINSAIKGEMDPIEKYGVSLNAAAIKAQQAAMGLDEMAQTNPDQAKLLATLALIEKQSGSVAGQFDREGDTFAGQSQRMKAAIDDLKASIGTALLPIVSDFVVMLSEKAIPLISGWVDEFNSGEGPLGTFKNVLVGIIETVSEVVEWGIEHKDLLITIGNVLVPLIAGLLAYNAYTTVMSTVSSAAAAAQWLLNVALTANPIGLVIALVAGLVAGLVYLWNTNDGVREAVTGTWDAIKKAIESAVNWINDVALPAIKNFFEEVANSTGLDKVAAFFEFMGGGGTRNIAVTGGVGYAGGGVLPGYTPGRDVHSFFSPSGMRLNLSGGEGILRPEVIRALGSDWLYWLNSAARRGGVTGVRRSMGFANGGVLGGVSTAGVGSFGGGNGIAVNVYVQSPVDGKWVKAQAQAQIASAQADQRRFDSMSGRR